MAIQQRILVTLSSTSIAFSMLLAPCITSYAADDKTATVVVNDDKAEVGNITITDGTSAVDADNAEVTVDGNITTSGSNSSYDDNAKDTHLTASPAIDANDSSVTVNGNVTAGTGGAEQTAILAVNNSNVTVNGNVSGTSNGIDSTSSSVTVNGNVSGSKTGISASSQTTDTPSVNGSGPSTVTVNGNVTSHGIQTDVRDENGNIIGTTETGTGVYSYGENNITVTGDVYSAHNGVEVNIGNSGYENEGQIIVEGTITGTTGLSIHDNSSSLADGQRFTSSEDVLSATPEIIIYEIDSDNPISVNITGMDSAELAETRQQLIEAINYIIKQDSASVSNYGLTVSGDNITNLNGHNTVNIGEAFTVAANVPEGYTLSGGSNVTVIDNHNGTFTLTLIDPKGGIYVAVNLKPVTNPDGTTSYVAESDSSYNDPNQAPAGAIVLSTNAGSADASAFIAAISGDKPAQTLSFTMSSITPGQYKNAIISSVANVPANGAFNIITDQVACLDAGMIAALSARPDIDINIVFNYGGKQMKVTIPAGYDLNSLLDEFGYCGFLRLMSILGATEL